jgi:hypothetical protein
MLLPAARRPARAVGVVLILLLAALVLPAAAAAAPSAGPATRRAKSATPQKKPCRIFIWDAESALSYCRCTRTLRINRHNYLYWGKKGRFLRLPFGCALMRFWPCSQFAIDRCMLCGCSFREHLAAATVPLRAFEVAIQDEKSAIALQPRLFDDICKMRMEGPKGLLQGLLVRQGRVLLEGCGPYSIFPSSAAPERGEGESM